MKSCLKSSYIPKFINITDHDFKMLNLLNTVFYQIFNFRAVFATDPIFVNVIY